MSLEVFSARLKDLMELEGISKRTLSIKINVDRTSIRFWLKGRFYPRCDALIKLAAFFRVRIDSLLGLEAMVEGKEPERILEADFKKIAQEHFCEKVHEYMDKKHLTNYALAKNLHIDQKAFTNWFKKGSMPETATIIRLAKYMHGSVDELLG